MAKAMNLLIAGFGGQGVLFTGKVVAYAGLIDGQEVTWMPSYGPETRGGTSNCSVVIADEPVGSPLVTQPDVLIVMNEPSFVQFIDSVVPGGKVFYDSSLIGKTCGRKDIEIFPVPATRLSNEEHLEGIANMILLGKVFKETEFADITTVEAAIGKCVPPKKAHLLEHNIRAVKLGSRQ